MRKLILLSLFSIVGVIIGHNNSYAQIASDTCDNKVYNQLSSRAWLEAEREVMQNQNLIFKADSVMEYSCLDHAVSNSAWAGGNVFTHTPQFGKPELIPRGGAEGMEVIFTDAIWASIGAYRGSNFGHSLLGGRGQFLAGGAGADTDGDGYGNDYSIVGLFPDIPTAEANGSKVILPPPGTIMASPILYGGPGYSCDVMRRVWHKAKCLNFLENDQFEKTDGFYPFSDLFDEFGVPRKEGYTTKVEIRDYPDEEIYKCDPDVFDVFNEAGEVVGNLWGEQLVIANNWPEEGLYDFQTPLGQLFKDVFERIDPADCGASIETGITVVLPKDIQRVDGVCTNPGCTFSYGSCTVFADRETADRPPSEDDDVENGLERLLRFIGIGGFFGSFF